MYPSCVILSVQILHSSPVNLNRPPASVARLLAVVLLSCGGMALWMLWNWSAFGDPLYFHRAEYYSAAWQAMRRPVREMYYLQLGNSLGIYSTTLVAIFGYVWILRVVALVAVA